MSIQFKKIRWRNFLSTGNQWTEIQLNKSTTTLIVGENGAGKSTILDALCFGLFGKAFRNINKPQLCNSINGKDCIVEIEFRSGTKDYKIVRGIKPNIFNIFQNDELINQDSAAKDYQLVLEEQILKFNYKAFTQIDVLGSASFTPFMQLPLAHRREVIEDILDIQIFSTMNTLLKDRISTAKDRVRDIESKIEVEKHKVKLQKEFIKNIETNQESKKKDIEDAIAKSENDIVEHKKVVASLLKEIQEKTHQITHEEDFTKRLHNLENMKNKLNDCETKLVNEVIFYETSNACPTCKQTISSDFKNGIIEKKKNKKEEVKSGLKKLEGELQFITKTLISISNLNNEIKELNKEVVEQCSSITSAEKYLNKLRSDLKECTHEVTNIESEKQKLKAMAKSALALAEERVSIKEELDYLGACSLLLKDTGIKTKIINQYLPIINKTVNKYLSAMDFFVHFELDEAFNEVIRSRYRDDFSYASFSEGEKQRIDLALLFTWRTIARLKNSVHTNLLILDEIFDSSLDANGTDFLMTLLSAMGEETNLFVISHKGDVLFDKFRSVVRFEKHHNFSVVA
jgi:DNA repair exonuclease SbcCD ATPase subunit